MTIHFGRRELFAIELEWDECPRLGDDGQRVTFAQLTIFCAGQALTRHVDRIGPHEAMLVPASSIAIWIGRSWPGLAGAERMIGAPRAVHGHALLAGLDPAEWDLHELTIDDWLRTHALDHVGDGLLLPNVIFWRRGDEMDVSWLSDTEPRTERMVQYLQTGHTRLPVEDVLGPLRKFVDLVGQRIIQADVRSASRAALERVRERMALPLTDQSEALAARLGLSPPWLAEYRGDAQRIKRKLIEDYDINLSTVVTIDQVDSPIAMAARSASPDFSRHDHERLIRLGRALTEVKPAQGLLRLRQRIISRLQQMDTEHALDDHEIGYRCAKYLRMLEKNPRKRFEIEQKIIALGCPIRNESFDDAYTDGLTLWRLDGRALVAANLSSPRTSRSWGRRAMLAHELYHLLFDATDQRFFGECTGDWTATPSERKANAFAAELLLPSGVLPENVSQYWTKELELEQRVTELCHTYGVGRELVIRQLQNHRHLPRPLVDALLSSPEQPGPA